jgi:hypothetical protein
LLHCRHHSAEVRGEGSHTLHWALCVFRRCYWKRANWSSRRTKPIVARRMCTCIVAQPALLSTHTLLQERRCRRLASLGLLA